MIHWLLQRDADGMPTAGWLSTTEQARLALFRSEKRRQEWLLGRWTAKRLVQGYLHQETGQPPPLDALVIVRDPGGAPAVLFDRDATPMDLPAAARWISRASLLGNAERKAGQPSFVVSGMALPISLSISHSQGLALCALYTAGETAFGLSSQVEDGFPVDGNVVIGIDIERSEPRPDSFVQAYFTSEEIHWIGQALGSEQALLATATWSAKEAVLKALQLGLVVDTRRVQCLPAMGLELAAAANHGWNEVHITCDPALLPERNDWQWRGWWRREGAFVLTLAALYVEGRWVSR
ncbi:MAG: 4'-phosphopantetheinyl transferase superfamily protein [Caldilineales bacterium]